MEAPTNPNATEKKEVNAVTAAPPKYNTPLGEIVLPPKALPKKKKKSVMVYVTKEPPSIPSLTSPSKSSIPLGKVICFHYHHPINQIRPHHPM
jgi:hypothetical protein